MSERTNSQDLLQFIESLRREHELNLNDLRKKTEWEVAEAIATQRMAVEKRIVTMRADQENRADALFRHNVTLAHSQFRKRFLDEYDYFVKEIEIEAQSHLKRLRQTSSRYEDIMARLVLEAMNLCTGPCRVKVLPGDSSFVPDREEILSVKENLSEELWGGCIVTSEDNIFIIDNTFKTRWQRLEPAIIRKISREARTILQDTEFMRELRIS
ncbi:MULTISPECIES: V-type ATP synthase subunit E [Aminobacterium]|uniref:V-type ATP synthase subunit E n=1 Tax=Aminobacterium TaxID=81466 RepID=UPI000463048F|nr:MULTISPECIES: V-type ATP synthase subunit E [Aminobacterium]